MARLFGFSSMKVPPDTAVLPRKERLPAVDPEARDISDAVGPETPLTVEFVGISAAQQQAALAAFPGGRRFQLATDPPAEGEAQPQT
jgi:hypothetical protein